MLEAEDFGQAVLVEYVTAALGFDRPAGVFLTADGAFIVDGFEVVIVYLLGILGEGFGHGERHFLGGRLRRRYCNGSWTGMTDA